MKYKQKELQEVYAWYSLQLHLLDKKMLIAIGYPKNYLKFETYFNEKDFQPKVLSLAQEKEFAEVREKIFNAFKEKRDAIEAKWGSK